MANTFSQSLTATAAQYRYNQPKEITIGDTDLAGNVVAAGNASFIGAQQGACMRNAYFLSKGPDGILSYHVIDAERSVFPGTIVLRKI